MWEVRTAEGDAPLLEQVDEDERSMAPAGLVAWSALFILAAYMASQIAGSALVGVVVGLMAGVNGHNLEDPATLAQLTGAIAAPAAVVGILLGGIVILNLTRYFLGPSSTFRQGIGWSRGRSSDLALGFAAGGLLAVSYLSVAVFLVQAAPETPTGPVTQMASTPGIPRLSWVFLVLAVAPPLEEFLFRGVLFTGLSRTWGLPAASVMVTGLFFVVHLPETIHYWPAMVSIGLTGVFALLIRIRAQSVGPAVALHFAYNLVIAAALFV